jgi:hypothetical protein
MLTISATEIPIHTQNTLAVTAASAAAPRWRPIQNASAARKVVMSRLLATAGAATRHTSRRSGSRTSAGCSPVAETGTPPSRSSMGKVCVATGPAGGRARVA